MLSKYLKLITGETSKLPEVSASVSAEIAHAEQSLAALPPVVASELGNHEAIESQQIDTLGAAAEGVVSSVMEIDTHGKKNSAHELRQRILGRFPVLDRSQNIFGYELVLRNKSVRQARKPDDALLRMQDEMLMNGLISLEMDKLTGDKLVFISLSSAGLDSPLLEDLPRAGVVLIVKVVPEKAEEQLLRLKALVAAGFGIALDDFVYAPVLAPFLRLAKFVRIDVSQLDAIEMRSRLKSLMDKFAPQLLAGHVEFDDTFEACRNLSFNYFQGYYFTRLQPDKPPRLGSDRMRVIELLNLATRHAAISQLENIFKLDATLSYKLLRYINSPGCGIVQKTRSIAHALVILGHDQLYRWLTLLLFSSDKSDGRSLALLKNALVRARLVEMLGQRRLAPAECEGLFIVGIFSLLDALLNLPMNKAVAYLNLPEPVLQALVDRKGVYAPFLLLAEACEEGDQDRVDEYAAMCELDADGVNLLHLQAMIWAEEIDRQRT